MFSRASTWGSQFPSNSFAAQEASRNQNLVEENYPTYFITWDTLKAWLEKTFPNPPTPYTEKVEKSQYYFWIPRQLTDADRAEIKKEHDRNLQQRSDRAVSPGG